MTPPITNAARSDNPSVACPPPTGAAVQHAADDVRAVDAAIGSRHSIRAYLSTPVPRSTIEEILAVAARAPSGTNTQPWKVHVLTGEARTALCHALCAAYDDPEEAGLHTEEYAYYPTKWVSPYIERRRKVGWDLYGLLGIGKTDKARMHAQHRRNYEFFGAPVGLIFTIDRIMQQGSWLDYGMFLQNIMVAARARGLDTCPQAAFTPFHRIIERQLGLAADEMVVCGMSLGVADPSAERDHLPARAPSAPFGPLKACALPPTALPAPSVAAPWPPAKPPFSPLNARPAPAVTPPAAFCRAPRPAAKP
mgnify:CR=1 FL=1